MYFTLILLLILNLTLEINLYILKTSGSFLNIQQAILSVSQYFFLILSDKYIKRRKDFNILIY